VGRIVHRASRAQIGKEKLSRWSADWTEFPERQSELMLVENFR
jgi:hypothetical protein